MTFHGKISKNKYWEIQCEFPTKLSDWFRFEIELNSKCDHAGFRFEFELLKLFYFHLWIYDHRHWDYDNNKWEVYDDDYAARISKQLEEAEKIIHEDNSSTL